MATRTISLKVLWGIRLSFYRVGSENTNYQQWRDEVIELGTKQVGGDVGFFIQITGDKEISS